MAIICPTVTAYDMHEYREQVESVEPFAERVHLDLMDGQLAPTVSPSLEQIWLPKNLVSDVHLMYKNPGNYLDRLIELRPSLVIIHAEANVDYLAFAASLKSSGIKVGLALLQDTSAQSVDHLLGNFDHVLIFAGNLGRQGGVEANLDLLAKVATVRANHPDIEISWDGGINDQNAPSLIASGIQVLNVGGFIQKSDDPEAAYAKLRSL